MHSTRPRSATRSLAALAGMRSPGRQREAEQHSSPRGRHGPPALLATWSPWSPHGTLPISDARSHSQDGARTPPPYTVVICVKVYARLRIVLSVHLLLETEKGEFGKS